MFTVIITEKGGEQRRLDFDKPEVTIGRVQGNDIILPKGNVSKRHSRIVLKDGKFIIVDLKSTNGTYVNGRKITSPLVLKETDKVYIGDFIITVEEQAGEAAGHTGSLTPIPPPAAPSGVYEPGPTGTPSLISNPPPVPKRTSPPMPPPMPGRRPPVDEDVDLDESDLDHPARPTAAMHAQPGPPSSPPQRELRDSAPGPRSAPPPPREAIAARAQAVNAAVGRTTSREESPPIMPQPVPVPVASRAAPVAPAPAATARVAPAAPPPVVLHGGAEPARSPRSTLKSFDAVPAPPPEPVHPVHPAAHGSPAPAAGRLLELRREIADRVAAQLDLSRMPVERLGDEALWQRAESALVDLVEQMEADGALGAGVDQDALVKDALHDLLGAGPLEELLVDDTVTDIHVDRHDRILIERAGRMVAAAKVFSSESALRQAIERLVAQAGRRLDAATPLVDAWLPGGTHLWAALPPLAVHGPCLTIRKSRRGTPALDELVRAGTISPQMATFLTTCVSARRNVVICGGPAAGKSTLLATLAALVPPSERVVSVEEVAELPAHDGRIALEARPAGEGRPGVSLAEAVRAALRLRPDRLVVGEVRGAEALEVLAAMGAGDGSLAAVAGENPAAGLARLESLARLGAADASTRALRELVAHAAHIVLHVARYSDGVRRVSSVAEVTGLTGDGYATRELFQFQMQGHGPDGSVRGRFTGAGVVPRFYEQLEARGEKADASVFR